MDTHHTRNFAPPFGPMTATITDTPAGPALACLEFGLPPAAPLPAPSDPHAALARVLWQRLEAYFAGDGLEDHDIPLALAGPPFTARVWERLRQIPFGQTTTYGAVAVSLASPAASRAVGQACRTNPVAILVPCHRVLDAGGSLHGYAGGLDRKRALLAAESALVAV